MAERIRKKKRQSSPTSVTTDRGKPLPFGVTVLPEGVNFSVFSKHATELTLILYKAESLTPFQELRLDPQLNRTGDIWHILVHGIASDIEYGFRASMIPNHRPDIYRFDSSKLLIDPYAKSLSGGENWRRALPPVSTINTPWRRSRIVNQEFDWEDDRPLNYHLADSVIYELHVRGFTRHPTSAVDHQGTFKGLVEKIPYLNELGVTTVELMPVTDFLETDCRRYHPVTGDRLINYWGYHPISFFALKASYAAESERGGEVWEFKEMVKALHAAGIEVILDVVFNHTGESDERYETLSFRGLDNPIYYIVDSSTGELKNYSGCGNTINCNHTVVRVHIIDSLRYWVTEMHIDGFRFDLASILARGIDGNLLAAPPLLEQISNDPVLSRCKLIAEPWDAAGAYHVGSYPHWGRWAEWNGKYRDDIRRFWRGDEGKVRSLATRLCGSAELYLEQQRAPYHSINFITSHDGFTLADLVTYQEKHNEANGEQNRDGENLNFSCNWGVEGPTNDPAIPQLRKRMIKNYLGTLLLSHGVPMLLAGDEFGRTQQGNNNAYCQDNEISWVDWNVLKENQELFRFVKRLIGFRKRYSFFRPTEYLKEEETFPTILWHGVTLLQPDWNDSSHAIALEARDGRANINFYMMLNAYWEELTFELPGSQSGSGWSRVIDTALSSPDDIIEEEDSILLHDQSCYRASARSLVLLIR